MASDVVIKAEGLGKKYVIGHESEREGYVALRDVLARNARNMARSARDLLAGRQMIGGDVVEDFWALKDVNFEINRGEVVGVIGRNGAGKSTLLKVLSRITEPTEGRVEIRGRVSSLLEVGTGFHPELSGRENIYLNGAILGMHRAEIRRKFDEIVDFAEVERFLDTPVKRYSSGMYVRLAFAIAAHLEPEILIVDEVLAVGDTEFQRKCLGKMEAVAGQGRSVIFVSHNLVAVSTLCQTGIVLSGGRAAPKMRIGDAIARYQQQSDVVTCRSLEDWSDRFGSGAARITSIDIYNPEARDEPIPLEGPVDFVFRVKFNEPVFNPNFGVLVHDALGDVILDLRSSNYGVEVGLCEGERKVVVRAPSMGLMPGQYLVSLWVDNERETEDLDHVRLCGNFTVVDPLVESRPSRLDRSGAKFWVSSNWAVSAV